MMRTLLLLLASATFAFPQGVGIFLHGADVDQNAAVTNGGYFHFTPITYNPYGGSTCTDSWSNPVQQPMPTGNLKSFGVNDGLMWVSASPSMPFDNRGAWSSSTTYTVGQVAKYNGIYYAALTSTLNQIPPSTPTSWVVIYGLVQPIVYDVGQPGFPSVAHGPCGDPLPVNTNFGTNFNQYVFARGGLATDNPLYNAIQGLNGAGAQVNTVVAGTWYPTGTSVCTNYNGTSCTATGTINAGYCPGGAVGCYLGGHIDIGHSVGPPASGGIDTVTNPFSGGEGLVAGMTYFDDGTGCAEMYNGTTWSAYACSSSSVVTSFNTRTGAVTLLATDVAAVEQDLRTSATPTFAGVVANGTFNSTATGTTSAVQQNGGTFRVNGDGKGFFQLICSNGNPSTEACTYGLTSAGVLTVASCTGCGSGGVTTFNSATGGITLGINGGSGTNGLNITTATGSNLLSLSQNLSTSGSPTFSAVTATTIEATTFLKCDATGSGVGNACAKQASGTWYIDGAGLFAGQAMALGSNNGTSATAGSGATVSNSGSTIGMVVYDTGGHCNIGTGSFACSSDRRLKERITPIRDGLGVVDQLKPVTFDWRLNGARGEGFIAQDVQRVLPDLVSVDDGGYLVLNEQGMIPYLARAIQELERKVTALEYGLQ